MKKEIPHNENPFKEQSELCMAWELGYQKCNDEQSSYIQDSARWSVKFRQDIRGALFPFYPNNPCSTDDELIEAVKCLVSKATKRRSK